jgi:hypothetical protein
MESNRAIRVYYQRDLWRLFHMISVVVGGREKPLRPRGVQGLKSKEGWEISRELAEQEQH